MKTEYQKEMMLKILGIALEIENKGIFEINCNFKGHVEGCDVTLFLGTASELRYIPTFDKSIYVSGNLSNDEQTEKFIEMLENIRDNDTGGIPGYDEIVKAKNEQEMALYNSLKAKFEVA
jgi:hypothetical protein